MTKERIRHFAAPCPHREATLYLSAYKTPNYDSIESHKAQEILHSKTRQIKHKKNAILPPKNRQKKRGNSDIAPHFNTPATLLQRRALCGKKPPYGQLQAGRLAKKKAYATSATFALRQPHRPYLRHWVVHTQTC